MTYVTEQTSQELRAHMRRLKAMAGWHEPLADRLYKEILDLDASIEAATLAERERCALVCEKLGRPYARDPEYSDCADAIRQGGAL